MAELCQKVTPQTSITSYEAAIKKGLANNNC